ncbi:MAG: PHP domain-containing protein [Bacteroidales bacterium]|jgi:energy-coupling factor transporter ATP-binding protein EcfA2|nr:PHP domain-containing protein [Bacteroidales bacterium]
MSEYRGSEWRKWDLHIHSDASDGKMTCDQIIAKAKELSIDVIALTDHHTAKNIDRIVQVGHDSGITVIPGIEFRTEYGEKSVHIIGLFPAEFNGIIINTQAINEYILAPLNISETEIRRKGREKAGHPLSDEQAFKEGMFEVQVDFKVAANLIHEKLGGIVVVHAGSKSNGLEQEIKHEGKPGVTIYDSLGPLKDELFQKGYIDICEITNQNDSKDFYLNRFNRPSIVASDAHSIEEIGTKYVWIKSDPTFEGLKQIMFEPKHRIIISEHRPFDPPIWLRKTLLFFPLDTLLNAEKFCYSGPHELFFSPNFTCLIGGRGTGKSMIINLLQEKFFPKSNEFFKERSLSNSATNQRLSIDSFIDAGNEVDASHIEFITQNEIQQLADDYLLFTNSIYTRIKKFDSESELDKLEMEIIEHDMFLTDRNNNLVRLIEKSRMLEEKKKELGTQKGIVDSFQNPVYDELANNIKIISEWLTDIKDSQREYHDLITVLRKAIEPYISKENNNVYNDAMIDLVSKVKTALESESAKDFSNITSQILQKESEQLIASNNLSEYLISRGVSKENLNDVSTANSKIVSLGQDIKTLSAEIAEIQKTLQSFSIQITNDIKDQYIASLDKKAKEINIQLASINSPFLKTISLKYEFDTPQAKNSIFEEFKDIFSRHLIGLGAKEPSLLELLFSIEPSLSIERQPLLDALSQNSSTSKAKQWLIDLFTDEDNFLIYQTIVLKHLFNAFQYKTIRVLYDDRRIEDSSFGQRCTATLVILLQLGNNPIVIDEPEAHLDSLLISNYLVELIKEKKKNRQIIFATHNANFVINGDADLIHILDMTDEKITSIRCTSIEDKMNRKSLIGLEGGKEAFLNREKKYFINEIQ